MELSTRVIGGRLFSWLAALVVALSGLVGGGVAYAQAPSIPEYTFTGTEYAFSGPDQIQAGLVTIKFVNAGREDHHLQLARLKDGKTMADLTTALHQGPEAALPLVDLMGGVPETTPGGSNSVTINLSAGDYAMICFITDPGETEPHYAEGMIKELKVTGNGNQGAANTPRADVVTRMKDFTFEMPAQVRPGQQTWQVTNDGPEPHEMVLMKVEQGKTMQDVQAYLQQQNPSGPPPATPVGGFQAMGTGQTAWATFNLQPGDYFAICFVPDPKTGKAHAELGMVKEFTVSGSGGVASQGAANNSNAPQTLPVTGAPAMWAALAAGSLSVLAGLLSRRRAKT